jgi:hypothetical protein
MDLVLSPIKDPSQNHTKGKKPLESSILTQCFFEVLGLILILKLKHLGMKICTILFKENEGAFSILICSHLDKQIELPFDVKIIPSQPNKP